MWGGCAAGNAGKEMDNKLPLPKNWQDGYYLKDEPKEYIHYAVEQERFVSEIFELANAAARAGLSIILAIGKYRKGERAKFRSRISVLGDHQFLDLQRELLDCWSKASHDQEPK